MDNISNQVELNKNGIKLMSSNIVLIFMDIYENVIIGIYMDNLKIHRDEDDIWIKNNTYIKKQKDDIYEIWERNHTLLYSFRIVVSENIIKITNMVNNEYVNIQIK